MWHQQPLFCDMWQWLLHVTMWGCKPFTNQRYIKCYVMFIIPETPHVTSAALVLWLCGSEYSMYPCAVCKLLKCHVIVRIFHSPGSVVWPVGGFRVSAGDAAAPLLSVGLATWVYSDTVTFLSHFMLTLADAGLSSTCLLPWRCWISNSIGPN